MDLHHELKSSSIKDIGVVGQLKPGRMEHKNQSQPLLGFNTLDANESSDLVRNDASPPKMRN